MASYAGKINVRTSPEKNPFLKVTAAEFVRPGPYLWEYFLTVRPNGGCVAGGGADHVKQHSQCHLYDSVWSILLLRRCTFPDLSSARERALFRRRRPRIFSAVSKN